MIWSASIVQLNRIKLNVTSETCSDGGAGGSIWDQNDEIMIVRKRVKEHKRAE